MEELKGESISIIDLTKIKNGVADYFVICSGNSDSHVDAIADSIEKEVYLKTNQNPWRKEGKQNREWILLDYVNIVAHVFKKEKRMLYDLESLWGDGIISRIEDKGQKSKPLDSYISESPKKKTSINTTKVKKEKATEPVSKVAPKKKSTPRDKKEIVLKPVKKTK
ncbi:MAG: ribosome silencing factor [Cytophagales bacterium]|nr:MAG: ribosome silencing factor [Cytophagales bacterium]